MMQPQQQQWSAPKKAYLARRQQRQRKAAVTPSSPQPSETAVSANLFDLLLSDVGDDSNNDGGGGDHRAVGATWTGLSKEELERAVFSTPPLDPGVAWADQESDQE